MGSQKVKVTNQGPLGYVFFTAWVGALVYFVQQSDGFGGFLFAIIKSIVWPGIFVHRILELVQL